MTTAPETPFLRVGDHPAIDFLNTAYRPQGVAVELLGSGQEFLAWLVDTGLLAPAAARTLERRVGRAALDSAAEEARRVREWARGWLGRWREAPRADYAKDVARLNTLLARASLEREVIASDDGLRLVQQSAIESADALLALVAAQIAAFVTAEDPALLKMCAGPGCTVWFLDRSRAGRRRFCTSAVCGNRAKVAAFRERQRAESTFSRTARSRRGR
jgi:predicted RNA-binding Zn ribbon-like protein